jgi:hypothetical protein
MVRLCGKRAATLSLMRLIDDWRDDLHGMTLRYGARFVAMAEWLPDCEKLNGRDLELWLPILAVAKLVGDDGVKELTSVLETFAVKSIMGTHDDIIPETDEILLRCLHRIQRATGITTSKVSAGCQEGGALAVCSAHGPWCQRRARPVRPQNQQDEGKRLFRMTPDQRKVIEQSSGIEFEPR